MGQWRISAVFPPFPNRIPACCGLFAVLAWPLGCLTPRVDRVPSPTKAPSEARQPGAPGTSVEEARRAEEATLRLLKEGRISGAYQVASTFNRTHPTGHTGAEGYRILGDFYVAVRASADALTALEKAVALAPDSPAAWRDLARAREMFPNNASTSKALEATDRAIVLSPEDGSLALIKARLLKRSARPEAREWFAKAVALSPERADAHRQFAEWLIRFGKSDGDISLALHEAEASLKIEQSSPLALVVVGEAKLRLGDATGAITPLKEAARLAPNVSLPARVLAQAYRQAGDRTAAAKWREETQRRTAYQNALHTAFATLSTRPGDRKLIGKMATLLGTHGEISEAVHYKAMALDSPPDSATVLKAVAADLRAGGYARAADALEQRVQNAPNAIAERQ